MKVLNAMARGVGLVALLTMAACGAASDETEAETNADGDLVVNGQVIADADTYQKALDGGSMVLYTGGGEESEQELLDMFSKDTGIKTELLRLVPNKLTERILSEQAADRLGADVIRTSDAGLIKAIADSGALATHEVPEDLKVPSDAKNANGMYYRTFDRVYALGYNNQMVSKGDAPATWEDLVDSRLKKKIGIVQVGAGGSTASLTRFQLDKFGEDYLEQYASLSPRIFDSASTAIDAVARGEIEVSPMTVGNAAGPISEGAPITLVFPEDGMPSYEFFLGVASGAKHEAAAQIFMNWSLSKKGQTATARQGDYPTVEGIETPSIGDVKLPARDEAGLVRYEQEDALEKTAPDAKLWSRVFGYTGAAS